MRVALAPHSSRTRLDGPPPSWPLLLRAAKAAHTHRTTGHAAEMAFFAVLTLVPSKIAGGSALGLSKQVIGAEAEGTRSAPTRRSWARIWPPR